MHRPTPEHDHTQTGDAGRVSHSGLVWFAEQCISNSVPLERYVTHAERLGDLELASFFRLALQESHRLQAAVAA